MINAPRHELDDAIDRVAAKMVAIDDDAGALQAAITRLPDRESKPWFLSLPVQATAAAALVLMAFLWARPVDRPAMPTAVAPIAATAPPVVSARMVAPASRRPDVRSPVPGPRIPAVTADRPDHERSLAAVDAIEAIELDGIAMPSIDLELPAAIEPLVLTDLALDTKGDS